MPPPVEGSPTGAGLKPAGGVAGRSLLNSSTTEPSVVVTLSPLFGKNTAESKVSASSRMARVQVAFSIVSVARRAPITWLPMFAKPAPNPLPFGFWIRTANDSKMQTMIIITTKKVKAMTITLT